MKGGVRLRGEKYSYFFSYKDEFGKWKKKEKGGFASNKEANAALRKAITEFEEDGFIQNSSSYTFKEYINYWFENVGELKLKFETILLYKNFAKNHINPALGHIQLTKINAKQLQSFFVQKQKILAPSSIKSMQNVFNNVFKLAIKQKIIKNNPMQQLEISPKRKIRKIVILTSDELNQIEESIKKTVYLCAFTIAIHTGMRRGEIAGLLWENIDFDANTIQVDHQLQNQDNRLLIVPTKTLTSNRTFKMTSVLHEYLREKKAEQDYLKAVLGDKYYKEHDFVCCYDDGRPVNPVVITTYFCNISRRLGFKFSFHDFRHNHATMMLEADANIKVLQERLGHSDIGTTLNTYSHVTKKLEDKSIDRFDDLFKKNFATEK